MPVARRQHVCRRQRTTAEVPGSAQQEPRPWPHPLADLGSLQNLCCGLLVGPREHVLVIRLVIRAEFSMLLAEALLKDIRDSLEHLGE